jgi:outer membrane lipoprotein-sorting protein
MNMQLRIIVLLAGIAAATAVTAQQNELAWTMERAVKQLDRQGSDLETVLADVDLSGTSDETLEIQSGRIYINDKGEFRLVGSAPDDKTILLTGKTVQHYYPQVGQVKQYSLSKHKNRLEQFIPLGFTITGKDLNRDFLLAFVGEETIGDRRTIGLELTPKKDDLRAIVSKIQIWIDEASWLPARQVISQAAGGQTLTVTYRGTARNLDLNRDLFKDNWPRGTKKERM